MRRVLACVCLSLVALSAGAPAAEAGNGYSAFLTESVGWARAGNQVSLTYQLSSPQSPCPSGNPVRFQFDKSVISDGTPLGTNCQASTRYVVPAGTPCGNHMFSAVLHNAGDTSGASDIAPASVLFTVNCPTPTPTITYPKPAPRPTPRQTTALVHVVHSAPAVSTQANTPAALTTASPAATHSRQASASAAPTPTSSAAVSPSAAATPLVALASARHHSGAAPTSYLAPVTLALAAIAAAVVIRRRRRGVTRTQ